MIAYCTGLRIGECLALQWSHIDMENRTLSVVSTLYDKKGVPVCKATPKTKSSVRTIPFNETLYKALLRHKASRPRTIVFTATTTLKAISSVPVKTAVP